MSTMFFLTGIAVIICTAVGLLLLAYRTRRRGRARVGGLDRPLRLVDASLDEPRRPSTVITACYHRDQRPAFRASVQRDGDVR